MCSSRSEEETAGGRGFYSSCSLLAGSHEPVGFLQQRSQLLPGIFSSPASVSVYHFLALPSHFPHPFMPGVSPPAEIDLGTLLSYGFPTPSPHWKKVPSLNSSPIISVRRGHLFPPRPCLVHRIKCLHYISPILGSSNNCLPSCEII